MQIRISTEERLADLPKSTGAVERNSGAARLMTEHKAEFCRIPVHCTDAARRALQNENHFARVVPYHTAAWPCAQKTMEI